MARFYTRITCALIVIGIIIFVFFVPSIFGIEGGFIILWWMVDVVALFIGGMIAAALINVAIEEREKVLKKINEKNEARAEQRRWQREKRAIKLKERKANICPQCNHFPLNKKTEIISRREVMRNVKHIFEKWNNYDVLKKDIINIVLEPQVGEEVISKDIYTCPICGYKIEKEPTINYNWSGLDEIRETIY